MGCGIGLHARALDLGIPIWPTFLLLQCPPSYANCRCDFDVFCACVACVAMCNDRMKSTPTQSQPTPPTPPVDVDTLAAAIAQRIARPVPLDVELWSAKEIASYLKVGARQVSERYALMPGFPKAIRLPTVAGVRGTARWGAAEVIAWAISHREGAPTSKGGRPRLVR